MLKIKILRLKLFCLNITLALTYSCVTKAHKASDSVFLKLSSDSLVAQSSGISDFNIQLINPSSTPFKGSLFIRTERDIELISKSSIPFLLSKNESLFIPVKIYISNKLKAHQQSIVKISLLDSNGIKQVEEECVINVAARKEIVLLTEQPEILFDETDDSLSIPVKICNYGNTSEAIMIVVHYPSLDQNISYLTKQALTLDPFTDTTIFFKKKLHRKILKGADDYFVKIRGLYLSGDLFGSQLIKVQQARSVRSYYSEPSISNNAVTISAHKLSPQNEWYHFFGSGSFNLSKHNQILYNIDASYWKHQGIFLQNTFITYKGKSSGLTAGNISRSYELLINGRGVVVFADRKNENAEAGYVEKAVNLFGPPIKYFSKKGFTTWAFYNHEASNLKTNSGIFYDVNPYNNTRSALVTNDIIISNRERYTVKGSLNSSRIADLDNPTNNTIGVAGGLKFNGSIGKLYLNSDNYISSPNYAGLARGSVNLFERIGWSIKQKAVWISANYSSLNPAPYPGSIFSIKSRRLRLEYGLSFPIGDFKFSISPSYNLEKGNNYGLFVAGTTVLTAFHVSTSVSYLNPAKQIYFFANSESGFYKASIMSDYQFHAKMMMNARYHFVSLSSSLQVGNFYVGEIIANHAAGVKQKNASLILNPQIQKDLFNQRIKLHAGLSFMKSSSAGSNCMITGRVEFDYTLKTKLFAAIDRNNFGHAQYTYNNIQIGITQKLPQSRTSNQNKGHVMEVFLFRDINHNQTYEPGIDAVAVNCYVYINGIIFITGFDGCITYKHLPDAFYRISVPPINNWFAPEKSIPSFTKNMRLEIPLQRTGVLKGTITYSSNKYSYEVDVNKTGLIVKAINGQGESFSSKTNAEGEFSLFLPTGEYDIILEKKNIPEEVECLNDFQRILITTDKESITHFQLKVKERKLNTKKFISPSLVKHNNVEKH